MNQLILLKSGEIALKGLNRSQFEDKLIQNAKRKLHSLGRFRFYKAQSTMYVEPLEENIDLDEALGRLSRVFGVAALVKAYVVEKDFEQIRERTCKYLYGELMSAKTFKVEAKRADKAFPLNSPAICSELGEMLLDRFPHLRVDVHQPDLTVHIEVREQSAFIHTGQQLGAGGIPVGSGGKAMLLVSGGIDSPVAGYMMAKRGLGISAVHFVSPPYTSERAKLKVIKLCEKLTEYTGRLTLHVVHFTEFQEQIRDSCPEELFTVIMRRFMMRIAEQLAEKNGCEALITGESVGQVASQTVQAIACTDCACQMPVLRPAIGMDKEEIVRIARSIDTFETSILPYEDCCTVFTPRHPKTKPRLEAVLAAESRLDADALTEQALHNVETIELAYGVPFEALTEL